jgi:hypothetical protein
MDTDKAKAVLADQLIQYRTKPYEELKAMIGQVEAYDISSPDGLAYQIEIQVFWDDKPNGDIRVAGAIDDFGWRVYVPLTDSFIVAPDGTFVDE